MACLPVLLLLKHHFFLTLMFDLAQCVAGSVGRQGLRPVPASERRTSPKTEVRRTVSIRLRRELAAGLEPATC